jgi:hypothetical protein
MTSDEGIQDDLLDGDLLDDELLGADLLDSDLLNDDLLDGDLLQDEIGEADAEVRAAGGDGISKDGISKDVTVSTAPARVKKTGEKQKDAKESKSQRKQQSKLPWQKKDISSSGISSGEKKKPLDQEALLALPINAHKEEILTCIKKHQVTVLVGETGSGKTTQVPQFLREQFLKATKSKILCTQPRRVAATSVAARVAEELGAKNVGSGEVGDYVGFRIRFHDCSNRDKTRIMFLTDGEGIK